MPVSVSPSTSVPLPSTSKVTAVSSSVTAVSSAATGSSFTGATLTVTVAVASKPRPSEIVYVKLSVPEKLASGVYVTVLSSVLTTTVPCSPSVALVTVSVSPSASVSLATTSVATGVSSSVAARSFSATGGVSSSTIVPTPSPTSIVALTGLSRLTVNASSASSSRSPRTFTLTVAVSWPGENVTTSPAL